jgi:phage terminase small subunit
VSQEPEAAAQAPAGEAIASPVMPDPPGSLVKPERVYWAQFAPLLAGARVLTPADVETLADYCRACAAVDDRGRRLRRAWTGRRFDQGFVSLLDRQLRGWLDRKTRLAVELGLTAVSRTRVAWSGHAPRQDGRTPAAAAAKSKLAHLQEQAAALRRPVSVKR